MHNDGGTGIWIKRKLPDSLKSMYLEVSMGHEMSKKIELKKLNKKINKN